MKNADFTPAADAKATGRVSLVGAGPGDPELWTVRAARLVREADLVLYDALVDAGSLRGLTGAPCFHVGKRAGRTSVKQETIHKLMIRAARHGKHVVRLKGGDPFVFGRGAEEALALAEAGIPFEIVPGVTTAVAAADEIRKTWKRDGVAMDERRPQLLETLNRLYEERRLHARG